MSVSSVAVIGAGASGLCAAKHLRCSQGLRFRVFERGASVGGTWIYADDVTSPETGGASMTIHSSVYRNLRSDIPREVMAFPDFPMESPLEHEPSYVHHSTVKDYLERYALQNHLLQHIEFHKEVSKVVPVAAEAGGNTRWSVLVSDVTTGALEESTFDHVMICNGHFSEPRVPTVAGIEDFEGRTVHSHSYRNPGPFAGQKVVIWGASSSACDIALEVATVAGSVTVCHRPTPWLPSGFPASIKFSANIISAYKDGFKLEDGTTCKADTLIYCTGYQYTFPFLTPECKIKVINNHVTPLYKHLINIEHPSMCLVGLPQLALPFIMFDFQVRYFVKVMEGKVALPAEGEMREEAGGWVGDNESKVHHLGERQWAYFEGLALSADLQPLPSLVSRITTDSLSTMSHDIANFKKYRYTPSADGETFTKVRV